MNSKLVAQSLVVVSIAFLAACAHVSPLGERSHNGKPYQWYISFAQCANDVCTISALPVEGQAPKIGPSMDVSPETMQMLVHYFRAGRVYELQGERFWSKYKVYSPDNNRDTPIIPELLRDARRELEL